MQLMIYSFLLSSHYSCRHILIRPSTCVRYELRSRNNSFAQPLRSHQRHHLLEKCFLTLAAREGVLTIERSIGKDPHFSGFRVYWCEQGFLPVGWLRALMLHAVRWNCLEPQLPDGYFGDIAWSWKLVRPWMSCCRQCSRFCWRISQTWIVWLIAYLRGVLDVWGLMEALLYYGKQLLKVVAAISDGSDSGRHNIILSSWDVVSICSGGSVVAGCTIVKANDFVELELQVSVKYHSRAYNRSQALRNHCPMTPTWLPWHYYKTAHDNINEQSPPVMASGNAGSLTLMCWFVLRPWNGWCWALLYCYCLAVISCWGHMLLTKLTDNT